MEIMSYIKLYQGDCLEILKTFDSNSVDVSFTSPPYNRKRNDKYKNYDDTIDDYYGFLCDFTNELLRITNKWVFVNVQTNYYNRPDIYRYIGSYFDRIVDIVIWEKYNPMQASGNSITNSYEFFITLGKDSLKSNVTYTKNHITTAVNSKMDKIHRAVMKQEVADWFITKFTEVNDIVLDPFMGLGTTGISCKKYNRNFIGIELDKNYFNISKERINNTTTIKRLF